MVLQSLWGLPLRHQQLSHHYRHHHHQHYIPRMSVVMASYFFDDAVLFFFFLKSHTAKSLWYSFGVLPEILLNRLPCWGKLIASHFAVFIFRGKNSCNFCSERSAVESKTKQWNVLHSSWRDFILLLIIKSLNNMKETTSRWIQITVIPFRSKKCTFGTERVSVLEICLSYKVLKMTGQKKRRD